jgi:hypothetical protein
VKLNNLNVRCSCPTSYLLPQCKIALKFKSNDVKTCCEQVEALLGNREYLIPVAVCSTTLYVKQTLYNSQIQRLYSLLFVTICPIDFEPVVRYQELRVFGND